MLLAYWIEDAIPRTFGVFENPCSMLTSTVSAVLLHNTNFTFFWYGANHMAPITNKCFLTEAACIIAGHIAPAQMSRAEAPHLLHACLFAYKKTGGTHLYCCISYQRPLSRPYLWAGYAKPQHRNQALLNSVFMYVSKRELWWWL